MERVRWSPGGGAGVGGSVGRAGESPRDQNNTGTSKPGTNGQKLIITIYSLDSSGIYSRVY